MKKIIELPEDLNDYILLKAKELAYTMTTFFEYIISPREHYVEISLAEMKPHITEQMLSYCIQNILGIIVDYNTNYTANYDKILNIAEGKTEYVINDFFILNMSDDLNSALEPLLKMEGYLFVSSKAMNTFRNYLDHVLNQALLALNDGNIAETIEADIKDKDIMTVLHENIITDGDNILYPKNYGFNDDEHNIMLQSFIWLLCGLTDWLDKDYIDSVDVTYMFLILFGSRNIGKTISSTREPDDIKTSIKEAMFINDFYINEKAVDMLNKRFSYINYYTGELKDQITKRINQFSINI
jgi:hypothetical protein